MSRISRTFINILVLILPAFLYAYKQNISLFYKKEVTLYGCFVMFCYKEK